ncbi:hypothetical protein KSS87_006928 [Heliosperma pusillum]|nr:hypothetical protein KSS87_006928 [Heliosperma pusillum]
MSRPRSRREGFTSRPRSRREGFTSRPRIGRDCSTPSPTSGRETVTPGPRSGRETFTPGPRWPVKEKGYLLVELITEMSPHQHTANALLDQFAVARRMEDDAEQLKFFRRMMKDVGPLIDHRLSRRKPSKGPTPGNRVQREADGLRYEDS